MKPVNPPSPQPRWSPGAVHFRSALLRWNLAAIVWLTGFALTSSEHMCALGYKTAERLAPYIVATLAALCVGSIRRYRVGVSLAVAVLALYLFAIYPAYLHWIHGPGRHHFPGVDAGEFVPEATAVPQTQAPTTL